MQLIKSRKRWPDEGDLMQFFTVIMIKNYLRFEGDRLEEWCSSSRAAYIDLLLDFISYGISLGINKRNSDAVFNVQCSCMHQCCSALVNSSTISVVSTYCCSIYSTTHTHKPHMVCGWVCLCENRYCCLLGLLSGF